MKKNRFLIFLLTALLAISVFPFSALAEEAQSISIEATASILIDADQNVILHEENAREKRYPASLTKMMTALLVMDEIKAGRLTMETEVTAGSGAILSMEPDGSHQNIKIGEVMTVKDLLYCAMLASANDACAVLAEHISGTEVSL